MSDIRTLWRSFAGGEITPELSARLDLQKFQTGLALCRNFLVLPHGPSVNRPGTEYVLEVKDSTKPTRVIPFTFSATETYILEIGHLYLRFHTLGGTVVESTKNITAITQANPGKITSVAHGYNNGDWVFLAAIGGMTTLNGRFVKVKNKTANDFEITDLAGVNINTTGLPAYTAGGTAARVYEIATLYDSSVIDLLVIHYAQSNDTLTLTHTGYDPRELKRITPTNWTLTTITFDPGIVAPAGVVAVATTGSGTGSYTYAVTAVSADGQESFLSVPSVPITNALWTLGNQNTVTWGAVGGAIRYNVYRDRGGLFSYIGQAKSLSFVDDNIIPDTSATPPEQNNPFTGAGNFPNTVSYFEQRRAFAGTLNKPQTMWLTRSGTDSDMSGSLPTRDADSISFRIASREANSILHIIPIEDLVLLTASAAWKIGSQNSDAITPSSISVKPTDYIGASNVQPVVTGKSILYGASRGGHLLELRYKWEQNGYLISDASIMAPHLLDGYTLKDMAFHYAPWKMWFGVRSDGALLGMTYVPQHDILGWHQHDTEGGAGKFESVATVAEGNEDATYFVIQRTVNARTVRYVERLHSPRFATLADAFYVDSGVSYSGAPITTLTQGLWHLEGKTVSILADGAVHPPQVVTNGSVTLQQSASKIQIGLPITADMQSLPLYAEVPGYAEGVQKNIDKVHLRLYRSSGVFAGPSFDKLKQYKQRTTEVYGSPPALKTGRASILLDNKWTDDGQVCIRQSDPLPLTVQSFGLEVAFGD